MGLYLAEDKDRLEIAKTMEVLGLFSQGAFLSLHFICPCVHERRNSLLCRGTCSVLLPWGPYLGGQVLERLGGVN